MRNWLLAATCGLALGVSGCSVASNGMFATSAASAAGANANGANANGANGGKSGGSSTSASGIQVTGAAAVRAGDDAQFAATLDGQPLTDSVAAENISWLVNGIPGGNAALGTISSTGHYTAPASLPTDPAVTISVSATVATFRSGTLSSTLGGVLSAKQEGATRLELWNPVPQLHAVSAREAGNLLEVAVSGSNFVNGASLKLDGNTFRATVISATELRATLPSGAAQADFITATVANPAPGEASSESITFALVRSARPSRTLSRSTPTLPATPFDYVKYAVTDLPAQYTTAQGAPTGADNTPLDNPITNAGATLGRVLFYDKKVSANNLVSCASCHQQGRGFSDPGKLSIGFQGGNTGRHSMGLTNAKYYARGRFFWDERAATLEAQVVQPIQDATEMGMSLTELETKLAATDYYPPLFQAAFGTPAVTRDRIAKALAQFVRSMVSYQSKYDSAFVNGAPNFQAVLTASELRGLQLFGPNPGGQGQTVRCDRCHGTNAFVAAVTQNTGLDAVSGDAGAGQGRFKVPSLRNVAVRGRFMHDGRFLTLEEVVQFYSTGVQNNPNLSQLLRNGDGTVTRLNLTQQNIDDLVAFMNTLTDNAFLNDPKFGDPFQ